MVLLLSSYLFYSWFDWKLSILIFSISFVAYATGLQIARGNKWIHWISIIFVLLVLGIFKYYNFFIGNINSIFLSFGYSLDIPSLYIILPIGISFYSFQAISYVVDVKRKTINPTCDLISFLTYMSFFPQLVAGPIERAKDFLPQILRHRKLERGFFSDGCRQVLWGFFKKLVVADNCAIVVNDIWNNYASYNGTTLLVGAILFTFQIYSDFSGYSDIAIGTAKLFGFRLSDNFRYPYFAESISVFWRRWHITLLSWFRDYVYIPLGGNRCSPS
ncbi:MAG: MBOAT family protein, partial [Prevotella sp.]|nr:MBOAT family protein [Prevotella sp.]